ncbi:hypothetical protein ACOCJ7_00985 [Knoellia sp. CPCC 206453]|uniref:hypothetical protein n=1 Tax=Knoellia pratensis TaxID=3404796 RepID=UPI00361004A0
MTIHSKMSMHGKRILATILSLFAVVVFATYSAAPTSAVAGKAGSSTPQHAFDWEIGSWLSSVQVLAEPLSPTEDQWLKFDGTSVVKPLMDGNANVVELRLTGPAGTVKGLNFRLFEPGAQRWSSTFANLRDGMLTPSVYGTFDGGVGTFYGDDTLNGQPIKVRFIVERQGPNRAAFTQAFSNDGGATWETNWIAVDRRM